MGEQATSEAVPAADTAIDESLLDASTEKAGADKTEGSLLEQKDGEPKAGSEKEPADKAKPTETPKDEQKQGAPEKYADPKLPDGMTMDPAIKDKLDAKAKSLGLTQESYQEMIDLHAEAVLNITKSAIDGHEKLKNDWKQETIKELGSDYKKELAAAAKAIDKVFDKPEENKAFRELMSQSGLGNHRLMVKFCNYFGKSIGEAKLIEGSPNIQEKGIAEMMFPNLPPK